MKVNFECTDLWRSVGLWSNGHRVPHTFSNVRLRSSQAAALGSV